MPAQILKFNKDTFFGTACIKEGTQLPFTLNGEMTVLGNFLEVQNNELQEAIDLGLIDLIRNDDENNTVQSLIVRALNFPSSTYNEPLVSVLWFKEEIEEACPGIEPEQLQHLVNLLHSDHDADKGINFDVIKSTYADISKY